MDSSINKQTNCQYTIARSAFAAAFSEACQTSTSAQVSLNATGWLVQATTLLEIATRLVDDIGHGFSYVCFVTVVPPCGLFHLEKCRAQL